MYFFFVPLFFIASISASQYKYQRADISNTNGIIKLLSMASVQDKSKIVVFPSEVLPEIIGESIQEGKYFVAKDMQDQIVGVTKLYPLYDMQRRNEILQDELRCIGHGSCMVDSACFYKSDLFSKRFFVSDLDPHCEDRFNSENLTLYTGGDFVLPELRGRSIYSNLIKFACASLVGSLQLDDGRYHQKCINLVYGLSQYNDYEYASSSRTQSIVKWFVELGEKITGKQEIDFVEHRRYQAFLPKFKYNNGVLESTLDKESIPGFGNILTIAHRYSDALQE